MAKALRWTAQSEGETHTVLLEYSYLTGKAIVTIDGDRFDISVKPMRLRGSNQMFKLGEDMAVLDFPKKGAPQVILHGEALKPEA